MTEYRRVAKSAETRDAVFELKERLADVEAERERMEQQVDQAERVLKRWRATYNQRTNELSRLDSKITEITSALDILAPEVDDYGIPRRVEYGPGGMRVTSQ